MFAIVVHTFDAYYQGFKVWIWQMIKLQAHSGIQIFIRTSTCSLHIACYAPKMPLADHKTKLSLRPPNYNPFK